MRSRGRKFAIVGAMLAFVAGGVRAQDDGSCVVQPPDNTHRIDHGPYPTLEELRGEWIGSMHGGSTRKFLRVVIDCETPRRARTLGVHGWEVRSGVAITGSNIAFSAPAPAGELQFSGFLSSGVLRGVATTPQGQMFFHLEPAADAESVAEFEGLYDTGFNEWSWLTRREEDGQLVYFNGTSVTPVFPTRRSSVISLAGDGALLVLDQDAKPAQAWLGDWNSVDNIGIKRPIYFTREIDFHDGTTTRTATLHLPSWHGRHPAILMMVEESFPRFDERLLAHELARRDATVLRLPRDAADEGARAALEFLRAHRDVDPEHIGLLAQGARSRAALELLDQDPDVRGAAFISPPVELAGELAERTVQATRRAAAQHTFAVFGAADPALGGKVPALPPDLFVYTEEPFSNLVAFEGADAAIRLVPEDAFITRYPDSYFDELRRWVAVTIYPRAEETDAAP